MSGAVVSLVVLGLVVVLFVWNKLLMCVCIASAAAFLTPVATPANMMVMGPAGYRFGDYWKLGLPMVGVFFVVAVGLVPLVWPL